MPKTTTTTTVDTNSKSIQISPAIAYRLSEKFFWDLGWTAPPSVAKQRDYYRAVTMKAKFSHPVICPWFRERREDVVGKYPDGSVCYLALKNGSGKIFYPSGRIAIRIERGGREKARTKVWIYSSGETERAGRRSPAQFCALFDSLGNGIVYDDRMRKRLVYNQEEGEYRDSPEGMPVRWRWHDSRKSKMEKGSCEEGEEEDHLRDASETGMPAEGGSSEKRVSESPVDSFADATVRIVRSRYVNTGKANPRRVSPIKPIVMQLNRYVSLRILDQADVSIGFFAGGRQTQIRVGILYNPFDQLRAIRLEESLREGRILFPYEDFPPKTRSLMRFQKMVEKLKRRCLA